MYLAAIRSDNELKKGSATAASCLLQLLAVVEEKEMNDFYFCPSKDLRMI